MIGGARRPVVGQSRAAAPTVASAAAAAVAAAAEAATADGACVTCGADDDHGVLCDGCDAVGRCSFTVSNPCENRLLASALETIIS
jgi:hypothetical protein